MYTVILCVSLSEEFLEGLWCEAAQRFYCSANFIVIYYTYKQIQLAYLHTCTYMYKHKHTYIHYVHSAHSIQCVLLIGSVSLLHNTRMKQQQ